MWTMLLCWACGGNRFDEAPPSVERTSPWVELGLPDSGRTVVSAPDGLVVRYPHEDVAVVDRSWRLALETAGYELSEDSSRDTFVACSWTRGEHGLALSVSAIRGTTTVSLQELP